jgi:hypothetical protein
VAMESSAFESGEVDFLAVPVLINTES